MVRNARLPQLVGFGLCLTLIAPFGCSDDVVPPVSDGTTSGDGDGDPATTTTTGDGDGDPTTGGDGDGDASTTGDGDGDGPTTGDGDGDETTTGAGDGDGDATSGDGDGDPGGDGDGDPSGDGDGDGEGTGDGDGEGTGDGDGEGMETDEGGFIGFVPDGDFGMPDECDPWLQDCMDGEKCVPYASNGGSWDANKCVPVMGDGQVGEGCTYDGVVQATDTCGADSMCWNVDDNQMGTCTAFCTGTQDDPICDPNFSCSITNNGSITICLPNCDPLLQDCGPDLGCYWVFDAFSCVFTTQDLETGEPCGFLNDCAPGNYCTAAETLPNCGGNACCANYCDLDNGNADCDLPGTECVPFFENPNEAPPGDEDVGLCLLPA